LVVASPPPDAGTDEFEFLEKVSETLATFAERHLACMGERYAVLLQQMLACSQHTALKVAAPSIPTWIALLREAQIAAEKRKSNTGVTLPPNNALPGGVHQALLQVCGMVLYMTQRGQPSRSPPRPSGLAVLDATLAHGTLY